jgi:hypothetical protein
MMSSSFGLILWILQIMKGFFFFLGPSKSFKQRVFLSVLWCSGFYSSPKSFLQKVILSRGIEAGALFRYKK